MLWDLATGQPVRSFDGHHAATLHSLSFSPDGRTFAETRRDGTIQVRDVPTCRVLVTIPAGDSELLSVRFSPDGRAIAATYRGRKVCLYSTHGEVSAVLQTIAEPWTATFSPNGEHLAVGCWGFGEIQVWELATNTLEVQLEEPRAVVWEVAYMPADANILASCSDDGTVQLWDLREQCNLLTLEPFGGFGASSVSFTPDGKTLVATGSDGSLCLWDLEYFERHMAGNLRYQMDLLRDELGNAIQSEYLTAWADEVMRRPWPRIGPRARTVTGKPTTVPDDVGVGPEAIASWAGSGPAQFAP
jgi:WD40 repeat protein